MTYEEFREAKSIPIDKKANDDPSDEVQVNAESVKHATRYPTFAAGMASQFYEVLKNYFVTEDHVKLKKLLLNDQARFGC